jgi:PAS domain S-box-containing protein
MIRFAMAMLALLFWFSYRNAASLLDSEQWEIQNHSVAMEFDRLLSALTAAESGERSYLITGDGQRLEPYRQASALAQLTQANPQQQQRLREISGPVVERLGELDRTIAARREPGFEADWELMRANFAPVRLDIIRPHVEPLMEDERRSRQQRMEAKTTNTSNAIQTGTLGVGLVFAMLGLVYFLLRREIAERKLADTEVTAHRGHPEALVEARTAELEREFAEHRRVEEALRDNEERLRLTLEASSTGTFEIDFLTGEAQWNDVEYALLGLKPGDIKPSPEAFFRYVHPADLKHVQTQWQEAGRSGHLDVEFRVLRADGEERWLAGRGRFAFADDASKAQGRWFLGVNFDITERKQAEATQARLAAIVEFSQDAIIGKNLDGIVTSWNRGAEQLFGYAAAEMLGKPFACMIPEDRLDEEMNILARIRRGDAVEHFETIRLRKDGSVIPIAITVSPVRDATGQVIGVSKIARDISTRKQAQDALALQAAQLQAQAERLREADRHKDEFLAMLAHELRNPLTPIHIAAQMLEKRGGEDPALVRWAGNTIKHQCEHLTQLVNQLLDVSRVSRGKITLNKSRLDLRERVKQAAATAKSLPGHDSYELILALPGEPIMLEADPVRLEQVLGNLLNNAFKYTPEGGRITLSLAQENATAVISVRDNGVGMSAAMLPRVFELFAQAERTLDRSQGGLGIGLALVKRLVELHGGSVVAFSAGPGQGSEFSVRLPLPAAPAPAPAPVETLLQSVSAAPTRRVLAVDDNEFVLDSLGVLLKSLGHEVIVARDGQEALNIASQSPLDIALIDIGLPGLDGYTVARRLRQEFAAGKLTLVAMTGYNLEEDRQKSKNAGFDHHLAKPFDPAALEKILADRGNEYTKPDNLYRR